jgi:methyl-accepting chemotaxis protein
LSKNGHVFPFSYSGLSGLGDFKMKTKPKVARLANKSPRTKQRVSGGAYVKFSDKLTESWEDVNRIIQENKATLDAIQETALELTKIAGALEAIATKYAKMVNSVLDTAVPVLKNIPLMNEKILGIVTDVEEFAENILDICTKADRVIQDVEAGLTAADVSKLKGHVGELGNMTKAMRRIIPASAE